MMIVGVRQEYKGFLLRPVDQDNVVIVARAGALGRDQVGGQNEIVARPPVSDLEHYRQTNDLRDHLELPKWVVFFQLPKLQPEIAFNV